MRIGNPNQRKLVEELKAKGYVVKVLRNQIHIQGVFIHPAFPEGTLENGYRVPENETIGLTIYWARYILENGISGPNDTVIKCPSCGSLWDGITHTHFMGNASCNECGTEVIKMKRSEAEEIIKLINSEKGTNGAGPDV